MKNIILIIFFFSSPSFSQTDFTLSERSYDQVAKIGSTEFTLKNDGRLLILKEGSEFSPDTLVSVANVFFLICAVNPRNCDEYFFVKANYSKKKEGIYFLAIPFKDRTSLVGGDLPEVTLFFRWDDENKILSMRLKGREVQIYPEFEQSAYSFE